ncbi:carboxymuconolactone decarboxylase family protein [Candidatus Accumulibacter sp. ACC003]|uniref:carboxymuconolactone decarboxylase family protein n=1 Tax=Candidatus Accumulibacter sp. ACC003 TaxID=2823334 RepID=UPI0025BA9DDE|nr:carboxymuconolactone decarboxylase family protein [Candidatus Accumulibacter sp. ACC003]
MTTPYANAVLDDKDLQEKLAAINPKYGPWVTRVAGEMWGLPLIDQKTKALIALTTDAVNQSPLGGPGSAFAAHVHIALNQGATRDEIEELFLFLTVYAGFNKMVGCFAALNDIMESRA